MTYRPMLAVPCAEPMPGDNRIADLVAQLEENGFAVADEFVDEQTVSALRKEILALERSAATESAGVGRGDDHTVDKRVRRSRIHWFEGRGGLAGHSSASHTAAGAESGLAGVPLTVAQVVASPGQLAVMALAEAIRIAVNRRLFLGLFEFEAQYAVYPPGGYYRRHLDSFAGARNRVLSLVIYLNEDWTENDGGLLRIWPSVIAVAAQPSAVPAPALSAPPSPAIAHTDRSEVRDNPASSHAILSDPVAIVTPRAGTIVLMLSEEIPHEVTAATRERYSVAGWYRVNQSDATRADPPL